MPEVAATVRKLNLKEDFNDDEIVNIDASFDGTWQKRGFSSLNGVVVIVIAKDTGKCIDYHVLSNKSSGCATWEDRKDTPEYERFSADHVCYINYQGSAGSMETAGMVKCFKQFKQLYKVRYTNYIGDGDSKSYIDVVKADPYNGEKINKLECLGHVQKRVGSNLRNFKKECNSVCDAEAYTQKYKQVAKLLRHSYQAIIVIKTCLLYKKQSVLCCTITPNHEILKLVIYSCQKGIY